MPRTSPTSPLTTDGHTGEVYDVTGPELLGFAEAVSEIAPATGRPMRYVPVLPGEYANSLIAVGVPRGEASALTELFVEVLDGRNSHLGDGVQRGPGTRTAPVRRLRPQCGGGRGASPRSEPSPALLAAHRG